MNAVQQVMIGIDGNEANVSRRVGSNVYAFELLWGIYRSLAENQRMSVVVYLAAEPVADFPPATQWWRYEVVANAPLWTLWKLPLALRNNKELDLFFSPGHYGPGWSPVPTIVSIMDVAYEFFPKQFKQKDLQQLRWMTRWSVRQAKHIVTISESSKRDVIEQFGRRAEDITVVYPAVRPTEIPDAATRRFFLEQHAIQQPYVLYVGTLQPRKNLRRLITAYEQLRAEGHDLQLVLAGKPGWLSEPILERARTSAYATDIRLLGYVTEEEKMILIKEAAVAVLVGLYEGFGIPPLEAILAGTPVVVSNNSSLPEVVGPPGIVVDPKDSQAIAAGLKQILEFSPREREQYVKDLQQYVKRFSWEESAEKVVDLLWHTATQARSL